MPSGNACSIHATHVRPKRKEDFAAIRQAVAILTKLGYKTDPADLEVVDDQVVFKPKTIRDAQR